MKGPVGNAMGRARGIPGILLLQLALAGCSGDNPTYNPPPGSGPPTVPDGPRIVFHVQDEKGNPIVGAGIELCTYGNGEKASDCRNSGNSDSQGAFTLGDIHPEPNTEYSLRITPPEGYSYSSSDDCLLQAEDPLTIVRVPSPDVYELDGEGDSVFLIRFATGGTAMSGKFGAAFLEKSQTCTVVMKRIRYEWKSGKDGSIFPDTTERKWLSIRSLGLGSHPILFGAYVEGNATVYDTSVISVVTWDAALERDTVPMADGGGHQLRFRIDYRGMNDGFSFYAILMPARNGANFPENPYGLDSAVIPDWGQSYGFRNSIALLGHVNSDSGSIARTLKVRLPAQAGSPWVNVEVALFREPLHSGLIGRDYEIDLTDARR